MQPGYINVINTGFVQSFGSLEDLTTYFSDLEKVSKIKLSGKPWRVCFVNSQKYIILAELFSHQSQSILFVPFPFRLCWIDTDWFRKSIKKYQNFACQTLYKLIITLLIHLSTKNTIQSRTTQVVCLVFGICNIYYYRSKFTWVKGSKFSKENPHWSRMNALISRGSYLVVKVTVPKVTSFLLNELHFGC